jgi:hypothetical protein
MLAPRCKALSITAPIMMPKNRWGLVQLSDCRQLHDAKPQKPEFICFWADVRRINLHRREHNAATTDSFLAPKCKNPHDQKCLFLNGFAVRPKFLEAKRNVVREVVRWSPFARAVTLVWAARPKDPCLRSLPKPLIPLDILARKDGWAS